MNLIDDMIYFYPTNIEDDCIELTNVLLIKDLPTNYIDNVIIRYWDNEKKEMIGEGFIYENKLTNEKYVTIFDDFFNLCLYNINNFSQVIAYQFRYRLTLTNETLNKNLYEKIVMNRNLLKEKRVFIQDIELKEDKPFELLEDDVFYLNEHMYRFNNHRLYEYDLFEINSLEYIVVIVKVFNQESFNLKYAIICIENLILESDKTFCYYNIYKQQRELYSIFHDIPQNKIIYKGNIYIQAISGDENALKKINKLRDKFSDNKLPFLFYKEIKEPN